MKNHARQVIFAALILGLLVSSWWFGFRRLDEQKKELSAAIQEREHVLDNLRQATTGIDDMGRRLDQLESAIKFFDSKLPKEKEIDHVLREVWQLAEANNLRTQTVKTGRTERGSQYAEQPIEMSLTGDFNGFYTFMLQLEQLPRITRVSNMDLKKITDPTQEMSAQMTLSVFFEPGQITLSDAR